MKILLQTAKHTSVYGRRRRKKNVEKAGIKLDDKKSTYGAIGHRISFPK